MDWVIFGLVVAWLTMISWFDIRKNEIPNSAWVIVPLVLACIYRIWQCDWELTLLALLVVVASERERISHHIHYEGVQSIAFWIPLVVFGNIYLNQVSLFEAMAISSFWIAWELKWWGGADATVAITLLLIWPIPIMMSFFLLSHLLAWVMLFVRSKLQRGVHTRQMIPGLPILLVSTLMYGFWNQWIR